MSSPSGDLRVALIGYGVAGAVFHARLIATSPGLRLSAVVTSDPERQRQVRSDHPGSEVLADSDALFQRADDWDLVVVASPNRTHYDLTTAALDAGLPVVVDKPFTPTVAQGRALIEHAERRGLLLTVFQNRRWDNDMLTVRRLRDAGELGAVHRFESRFERWVPTPKAGWRESGGVEEAGGVLYDLGSHLVDQALQLFGPVATVYAETGCLRPGVEVDDDAFVALTHISGVRSHLWMGKLVAQNGARFRVLGDRAAYTKYGLDPQEADLRAGGRPDRGTWGEEPEDRWGVFGAGDDLTRVRTEPGRYPDFYSGVLAALRDGAPPPVDPADAVAGLEIIEAARRSAEHASVQHVK
jgi:predicted dehydrogenase